VRDNKLEVDGCGISNTYSSNVVSAVVCAGLREHAGHRGPPKYRRVAHVNAGERDFHQSPEMKENVRPDTMSTEPPIGLVTNQKCNIECNLAWLVSHSRHLVGTRNGAPQGPGNAAVRPCITVTPRPNRLSFMHVWSMIYMLY
jgi:hypothetical protein